MSKLDSINEHFKVPIFYNKEKMNLKENIIQDLELVKTIDSSNNNTSAMYDVIFNLTNEKKSLFTQKITEQVSNYYTTDTNFLNESQQIIKNYKSLENYD